MCECEPSFYDDREEAMCENLTLMLQNCYEELMVCVVDFTVQRAGIQLAIRTSEFKSFM